MVQNKLTFSSSFKHLSIWRMFVEESEAATLPSTFKHLLQETTKGKNDCRQTPNPKSQIDRRVGIAKGLEMS